MSDAEALIANTSLHLLLVGWALITVPSQGLLSLPVMKGRIMISSRGRSGALWCSTWREANRTELVSTKRGRRSAGSYEFLDGTGKRGESATKCFNNAIIFVFLSPARAVAPTPRLPAT